MKQLIKDIIWELKNLMSLYTKGSTWKYTLRLGTHVWIYWRPMREGYKYVVLGWNGDKCWTTKQRRK